jgi:NADPH-dependent curcumin reductase CurA
LAPLETHLGVLGLTGMTAYFGLLDVGQAKAGETVLVSAAAGAVGSVAGQLARIKGCRVVGVAGGPVKCKQVTDEFGFDACIDYKADEPLGKAVDRTCPDGVDVYFDNTGGDILQAALFAMNRKGRVACCGAVSAYDSGKPQPGPVGIPGLIVVKRLRLEGFIVFDFEHLDRDAELDLSTWAAQGRLKVVEDVLEGLERAPEGLVGLLAGKNLGKRMIRVAPDPA